MDKFYSQVLENQVLFFIGSEDMVASVPSTEDEEVVCLWSEFSQAEKALKKALDEGDWEGYSVVEIPLDEALNYLLPTMEDSDLLIGLNWPPTLKGEELSCEEVILNLEKAIDDDAGRKLQGHLQESHPVWVIADPEHPDSFVHLAARSAAEGALAVWTDQAAAQHALAEGGWKGLELKCVSAQDFAALARGKVLAIDWSEGGLTPEFQM